MTNAMPATARVYIPPETVRQSAYWELKPTTVKVFNALSVFRNRETGTAWPANATLAAMCRLSIRTVQKALKELREAGFITGGEHSRSRSAAFAFPHIHQLPLPVEDPVQPDPVETPAPVPAAPDPNRATCPAEILVDRLSHAAKVDHATGRDWLRHWPDRATPALLAQMVAELKRPDHGITDRPRWVEAVLSGRSKFEPDRDVIRVARTDLDLVEQRFRPADTATPESDAMRTIAGELLALQRAHPTIVRDCRSRALGAPGSYLHTSTLVKAVRTVLAEKAAS